MFSTMRGLGGKLSELLHTHCSDSCRHPDRHATVRKSGQDRRYTVTITASVLAVYGADVAYRRPSGDNDASLVVHRRHGHAAVGALLAVRIVQPQSWVSGSFYISTRVKPFYKAVKRLQPPSSVSLLLSTPPKQQVRCERQRHQYPAISLRITVLARLWRGSLTASLRDVIGVGDA